MNNPTPETVTPCDFRSLERVSPDILEGLKDLQGQFVQHLSLFLSEHWGETKCRPLPLEQETHQRFLKTLSCPTLTAQIDISPYYSPLLLALDAQLIKVAISRMLKQPLNDAPHSEKLNSLERALALKFINNLLQLLQRCLGDLQGISFAIRQINYGNPTDDHFTAYQGYLTCPILVEIPSAGMIHFAIPRETLKDFKDLLPRHQNRQKIYATKAIEKIPVEVRAVVATTTISADVLATLRPGDLLLFQQEASTQTELKVGNITIAEGEAGLFGQYKGVRL